jgi:hypothetical protein
MKTVFAIIMSFFVFSSVFVQNNEKRYFENNPTLEGDVVIKSADVRIVSEEIFKTFEIESFEDGAYYLEA